MAYRLGNGYTLALVLTAGFIFGLAALTLRHRNERVRRPLAGFLLAIGLWAAGDAMRLAALTRSEMLLWNRVAYVGIVFVPPTLLLFVLSYTDRDRWLQRRYVVGLFSISVLVLGIVMTNHIHELWFEVASIAPGTAPPVLDEDWGPIWYVWVTYVYSVVLLVTVLMVREFVTASRTGLHRVQTGLVLAGLLVATGINVLFIVGIVPFDPTPFAFALTGLLFGVAIFRYRLLTLLPVARDTIVTEMDSGILVVNADDEIVDVNERFEDLFGLGDESVGGEPANEVFEDYPSVVDCLRTDGGNDTITVEEGGDPHHYDVRVSRMHDAVGTYIGRIVVVSDVTERVNRRNRLRDRTSELEAANERLDEFASVVSHDLRSPLAVINGQVELARGTEDPEPHLEAIDDATTRMEEMIERLLSLAREGETVGRKESVDLEDVATTAWAPASGETATLTVETTKTVQADPDRLRELFENVFRNAVEHGGEGVTVRVGSLPDGFVIEDDGPGIPEDERDRVLETGYTTTDDGSGFGLSIVETIAHGHGWEITVTESETSGARLEFTGVDVG